MKALPGKLFLGAALLAALALPAYAAKNNGGLNDKSLSSRGLMQGHKRSEAEKDARRTQRDLAQSDAEEKKREAELLKKFDVNHDGVLDDAEKATMEAALKKQQEKKDKN